MVIEKLQGGNYEVTPYRTMSIDGIYESMKHAKGFDCIISCGGDGTLNHVINAMVQNDIDVPVGILPAGTANDFAKHLDIPKKISLACDLIINGNITEFDLGKINSRYFVNVAAGGLLTDVSQRIDTNLKNTLGKMAYYLKGIEQLPNFKPIPVKIKHGKSVISEMVFLFLILNGSTAGGFRLAPDSTANDQMLNLVAVKSCNIVELFNLFIKMLKGEHLESNNVIYLKGQEFTIECSENIETDVDGEAGPGFPLNIRLSNKKIRVFTR
jgi:YegS/Rv2252/BmrU family lipid kinase